MKAETISAADGMKLAARVYEPDSPDRGSVVIGGAMGVRQDYYAPFAQWLAGQGWRVEAQLWPRMAEWLGALASPKAV